MGQIKVHDCNIEGLKVIEPEVFGDERGYFFEVYRRDQFTDFGMETEFVQDNESLSKGGVLRGLHFQINHPQAKIVRVFSGEVFDVAVDLRVGSPTFGKWHGEYLSGENHKQFFIPKGFAHGFYVTGDHAVFAYKCTDYFHPGDESGLAWDDEELGIEWPIPKGSKPVLSEKDGKWGGLAAYKKERGIVT